MGGGRDGGGSERARQGGWEGGEEGGGEREGGRAAGRRGPLAALPASVGVRMRDTLLMAASAPPTTPPRMSPAPLTTCTV